MAKKLHENHKRIIKYSIKESNRIRAMDNDVKT